MMRIKIKLQQQAEACNDVRSNFGKQLVKKGDGAAVSEHEILGIDAEEYHELIEAVRSGSLSELESELNDLAVACLLGIASIKAWEPKPDGE